MTAIPVIAIRDAYDWWRRCRRPRHVVRKESRLPVSVCVYYVYTIFMFNFHHVSKIASNIRFCTWRYKKSKYQWRGRNFKTWTNCDDTRKKINSDNSWWRQKNYRCLGNNCMYFSKINSVSGYFVSVRNFYCHVNKTYWCHLELSELLFFRVGCTKTTKVEKKICGQFCLVIFTWPPPFLGDKWKEKFLSVSAREFHPGWFAYIGPMFRLILFRQSLVC